MAGNGAATELEVVVEKNTPPQSNNNNTTSTAQRQKTIDEALELQWSDITIKHGDKKLLYGVSGRVKGRFLAIMGGSGSGKTTLLNFLARRLQGQTKQEGGQALLNEGTYTSHTLKQVSGYVMQDDLLFPNLTVEETLKYAAKLRLPPTLPKEEIMARVDDVINKLGLQHCRTTPIGDELKRGVSGGERKRVCVGIELLLNPNVLLLDEPTSGLDSASALSLCRTLKDLAASGQCTVICTIHQPQSQIFHLFDDLIVLNRGYVVYRGSREDVLPFYEDAGLPCPPLTNPADHILDVITLVPGADPKKIEENVKHLRSLLKTREERDKKASSPRSKKSGYEHIVEEHDVDLTDEEDDEKNPEVNKINQAISEWIPDPSPRTPWTSQYAVLTRRCLKETLRSRAVIIAQVLQNIFMAILIGTVFLHIGTGQVSTTKRQPALFFCVINQGIFGALIVINSFPSERKIVLRERAAGSYFVSAYYMAKITSETIIQITSPIIFSCVVYFLVGFQPLVHKFFTFLAFMTLCSLTATSLSLFVSAVCRTTTLAVSILPVALEISRLFGGFFLSPAALPSYFKWLDALSYAKYTYVGISLNELTGLTIKCDAANCPIKNGEQTIKTLGLDSYSIPMCSGILLVMIFVLRVGAYLAIRFIKN